MGVDSDPLVIGEPADAACSPAPDLVDHALARRDWRADRVREWLLAVLRYAVTWDPQDQAAVYALAHEIDAVGLRWHGAAPSFFRRTSDELCRAITAVDDPGRE